MYAFKGKPINWVQRRGAQAVVGIFLTVATSVAEAELKKNTGISHRVQAYEPGTKRRADENQRSTNEQRGKRIKIDSSTSRFWAGLPGRIWGSKGAKSLHLRGRTMLYDIC